MPITSKILGTPGRDNALFLEVYTGQEQHRIQMDCGEVSLHRLGKAVIQNINALCITHGHMDHISGFDSIFRHIYSRFEPFHIFGPHGITNIIHHRLQGYTWNLVKGKAGEIHVHEISNDQVKHTRFYCREAFSISHPGKATKNTGIILDHPDYQIRCAILDHRIDCLAYSVQETTRMHINTEEMNRLGLQPGPWCRMLKDQSLPDKQMIDTGKGSFVLQNLRKSLLQKTLGQKITYVTDIIMHAENRLRLVALARNSDELVIECTYLDKDAALAKKNYHLTVSQAVSIAKDAAVKLCTLFHVSDRYSRDDRRDMLKTAQASYAHVAYPNHWNT